MSKRLSSEWLVTAHDAPYLLPIKDGGQGMSLLQLQRRYQGWLLPLTSKEVLQQLVVSGQARLRRCITHCWRIKLAGLSTIPHIHMAVCNALLMQKLAQIFAWSAAARLKQRVTCLPRLLRLTDFQQLLAILCYLTLPA